MSHISLGAIKKSTGEYVYPKVANKADEHICPECCKDLILCQGTIRVHHFRHKVDTVNPCNNYNNPGESQIHKDAKLLLKSLLERKTPISFVRKCSCCKNTEEFEIPEVTEYSMIELEYRFEYNGPKIADVAFIDNGVIVAIFEICNTHMTCRENRPEPWFEIDAEALIVLANDNHVASLQIPCIREEKCDECMEKENSNPKKYNIEKYVRMKLGQTIFPTPTPKKCIYSKECDQSDIYVAPCGKCECDNCKYNEWYDSVWKLSGHLRFDFDARNYTEPNKRIVELFSDDFINRKVVVHSHTGFIIACIVSNLNYDRYDYWDANETGMNYLYGDMDLPYEEIINVTNERTTNIIVKLIQSCERLDETEKKNKPNKRYMPSNRLTDFPYDDKVYLNVDFSKKDLIKELGGKWDTEYKLWYISQKKYDKHEKYIEKVIGKPIIWVCKECEALKNERRGLDMCHICWRVICPRP
jgi:Domain of unknown function (DUF5710)